MHLRGMSETPMVRRKSPDVKMILKYLGGKLTMSCVNFGFVTDRVALTREEAREAGVDVSSMAAESR